MYPARDPRFGRSTGEVMPGSEQPRGVNAVGLATVGLIGLNDTGALAYALECGLARPTRLSFVRPLCESSATQGYLDLPVPFTSEVGDLVDVLVAHCHRTEFLVIQPPTRSLRLGAAIERLRGVTVCQLIEVDRNGQIVRMSEPALTKAKGDR
ncbi:hypothetical protein BH09ACT10_BH09ACT10_04380 [soil metagenome]